ncbi:MAG TPA: hypothetical protein VIQ26_08135 [Microbacteriaceae bacterium]
MLASTTAALALAAALCVCLSLGNASWATAASHTAPSVSAQLPITDDLNGFQLPTK